MSRKRITWLSASVLTAIVLGVWALWTVRLGQRSTELALQLEAERQRNFAELVGHMQNIQSLLGKGSAAGSVRQNMLYMGEVHRRASLAASNFMALPLPGPLSASTGKFLNQVGDFAYSIARNEAAGRPINQQQRSELSRLQKISTDLAVELQKVGRQSAQDRFRWVGSPPRLADIFTGWQTPIRVARGNKPTQDQPPKALIPGGLDRIGPQMDQLPVMVYDGPFSDHLQKRQPAMGGDPVSEAEARTRALSFVPNADQYTVVEATKRGGLPPTYSFRLATGAQGKKPGAGTAYTVSVDVTQAGGHLISYLNARPAGPAKLSLEQARDMGRAYLEQHGFPDMIPTYGEAVDGFATVQYVLRDRGILVYPDQIKLRIALDDGEVVGVDARAYVMSHRDRGEPSAPAVSQEKAAQELLPDLQVQRRQLTIIPTETGDNEVLAYEFMATMGDNTYLVYVNAQTGEEERILQMQTTPNGTLVL